MKYYNFRWYFGETSRLRAEEYLNFPEFGSGTFLVRESERGSPSQFFALTVKHQISEDSPFTHKHYLIISNDNKTKYWIKGGSKTK